MPPDDPGQKKAADTVKEKVEKVDLPEDLKQKLTDKVGSSIHEEWRMGRKDAKTGAIAPRFKISTDTEWNNKNTDKTKVTKDNDGKVVKTEVDIAKYEYKDLPPKWKAENKASGKVTVDLIAKALNEGKKLDTNFVKEASDALHEAWRDRNRAALDGARQDYITALESTDPNKIDKGMQDGYEWSVSTDVEFSKLSPVEQQKDIAIIEKGINFYNAEKKIGGMQSMRGLDQVNIGDLKKYLA